MPGFVDKLEKRFGQLTIPNITLYLVIAQVVVYGVVHVGGYDLSKLLYIPGAVLDGEVWRLITFLFIPPAAHPVFMAFAWYIFWMMGNALEEHWGVFRYNLFLLTAALSTIIIGFAAPGAAATNGYVYMSVFLAFAYVYPNFEFLLMFLIPVKVKWLAAFTWAIFALTFIGGDWMTRLNILSAVFAFFVFFGKPIVQSIRARQRREKFAMEKRSQASQAFHTCCECGVTDKQEPKLEFRFRGDDEYCVRCLDKEKS